MNLEENEIRQKHLEVFQWVRQELGVDSRVSPPYIWYLQPNELDIFERDIVFQVGEPLHPMFKGGVYKAMVEKSRVGLTAIATTSDKTTIFPGIILNKLWPGVITNPDRILLQENINSVIMRSSPIYQFGLDSDLLLRHLGPTAALAARDLLISFTERVGTATTERFSKKFGANGTYLREHEYMEAISGMVETPPGMEEVERQVMRASPTAILDRLLDQGKFNPAKQAKDLFLAYLNGIDRATPALRGALRQTGRSINHVHQDFVNLNRPALVKEADGHWTQTSTRRMMQR